MKLFTHISAQEQGRLKVPCNRLKSTLKFTLYLFIVFICLFIFSGTLAQLAFEESLNFKHSFPHSNILLVLQGTSCENL